jgi:hypothetical protein
MKESQVPREERTNMMHPYGGYKGCTFKEIPLRWKDNMSQVVYKENNWLTLHKVMRVGGGPIHEPLLWNNNVVLTTHKEERSYI